MQQLPIDAWQLKAATCKASLKAFIQTTWAITEPTTPLLWNWHLDAFCDHLQHIREIKNLLINLPPGTSKSIVFNIYFPAWTWINDPATRFLYASYSLSLSKRDSVKCKRLITSPLYQKLFGNCYQISDDANTQDYYANDKTGERRAISTGSGVLGHKCNIAVLDDPHNATDLSDTMIRETVNWFDSGFYSRLNDFTKDCRIVIGQRVARTGTVDRQISFVGILDAFKRVQTATTGTDVQARILEMQLNQERTTAENTTRLIEIISNRPGAVVPFVG